MRRLLILIIGLGLLVGCKYKQPAKVDTIGDPFGKSLRPSSKTTSGGNCVDVVAQSVVDETKMDFLLCMEKKNGQPEIQIEGETKLLDGTDRLLQLTVGGTLFETDNSVTVTGFDGLSIALERKDDKTPFSPRVNSKFSFNNHLYSIVSAAASTRSIKPDTLTKPSPAAATIPSASGASTESGGVVKPASEADGKYYSITTGTSYTSLADGKVYIEYTVTDTEGILISEIPANVAPLLYGIVEGNTETVPITTQTKEGLHYLVFSNNLSNKAFSEVKIESKNKKIVEIFKWQYQVFWTKPGYKTDFREFVHKGDDHFVIDRNGVARSVNDGKADFGAYLQIADRSGAFLKNPIRVELQSADGQVILTAAELKNKIPTALSKANRSGLYLYLRGSVELSKTNIPIMRTNLVDLDNL